MAVRLTKNKLKRQKETLKTFRRFLPTLQLKKQQLYAEIRAVEARASEVRSRADALRQDVQQWVAVFSESGVFDARLLRVQEVKKTYASIAGVRIPCFLEVHFACPPYDLYRVPLWVDTAVRKMQEVLSLDLEAHVLDEQALLLGAELRTTTQRVNLFEKVKIPETRACIRKITVYLGDQQVAAVVRGKMSKKNLVDVSRMEQEDTR